MGFDGLLDHEASGQVMAGFVFLLLLGDVLLEPTYFISEKVQLLLDQPLSDDAVDLLLEFRFPPLLDPNPFTLRVIPGISAKAVASLPSLADLNIFLPVADEGVLYLVKGLHPALPFPEVIPVVVLLILLLHGLLSLCFLLLLFLLGIWGRSVFIEEFAPVEDIVRILAKFEQILPGLDVISVHPHQRHKTKI